MSISQNYPIVAPSLNLDFSNTKTLDPRITFSRPTGAVYYDGKSVTKAEENLLLRSQEFDNAAWLKSGTVANVDLTVAPDGTTTATTVTATATNAQHVVQQLTAGVASSAYTRSVYLKYSNNQYVSVLDYDGAYKGCTFDVQNGLVGSTSVGVTASIQDAGSGWYRCVVTFTHAVISKYLAVKLQPSDILASIGSLWTASGTESVYIWGAQLEQRSTITAYTPTTTQPITNYIPTLLSAPADTARFDHDPVTGESLGLLVEEQRTNLLTYSEDFGNAVWTKASATITPNQIVAPDGTLTMDLMTATSTSTRFERAVTVSTNATYSYSIYAKSDGITDWISVNLVLFTTPTNTTVVYFDISNGVIGLVNGDITANIEPVGNGIYRCSVTFTTDATDTTGTIRNIINQGNGQTTCLVGQKAYFWGAQLEAGSFPTSYIKTEASQVTRSADSASMTGANFSDWYRADEGSLYAEYSTKATASIYSYSLGTYNNGIFFRPIFGQNMFVRKNSTTQAQIGATVFSTDTYYKQIGAYAVNDIATCANSGAVATDALAEIPVITDFYLAGIGFGTYGSLYFKKIAYYPQRLSNENLQALTS